MQTPQTPHAVHDNPARSRYELQAGDATAVAEYELHGNEITFTHTIVPETLRGQGIAGKLVSAALDSVRSRGLKVTPQCPVFLAHMKKHPETHDLLSPAGRQLVGA